MLFIRGVFTKSDGFRESPALTQWLRIDHVSNPKQKRTGIQWQSPENDIIFRRPSSRAECCAKSSLLFDNPLVYGPTLATAFRGLVNSSALVHFGRNSRP